MSSSSMPAAKRRRVDAATATLKKPFRSPVVKRPQPQDEVGIAAALPATPVSAPRRQSTELGSRVSTPSKVPHYRRPGQAIPASAGTVSTPSRPASRLANGQKTDLRSEAFSGKEAELLDKLCRRRKEAEHRVRQAEKEMELVRQAARIQSGKESTNEELEQLVQKWKGACRIAAEELFELIRGRVDSMGGGAAWRETRTRNAWFEEETAQERMRREAGGEGADEREELEGLEEIDESDDGTEQNDERDFTMHMMLKSLNIDPKAIGYDPVEDKWRDWAKDAR